MKKENVETLLVIGNGADLYCGLKSSFEDYLNKKEDYKKQLVKFIEFYKENIIEKVGSYDMYDNNESSVYLDHYRYIYPVFIDKIDNEIMSNNYDFKIKLTELGKKSVINDKSIFGNNSFDLDNLNFWDILLINGLKKENPNWYDVELTIKKFLVPQKEEKESAAMLFDSLMKKVKIDKEKIVFKRPFPDETVNELRDLDPKYIGNYFDNHDLLVIFVIAMRYFGLESYDNIYDFLFEELNKFENSFEKYIIKAVDKRNKEDPIDDIFGKRLYDRLNYNLFSMLSCGDNVNVLDFNYTKPSISDFKNKDVTMEIPLEKDKDKDKDKDKVIAKDKFKRFSSMKPFNIIHTRNIHGNIKSKSRYMKSSIILGIDANYYNEISKEGLKIFNENITLKENIDEFTKARRIMDFSGIDSKNEYNTILDEEIKKIRFFGHSLGSADYSYFQAIFDYYDIYNNPISLEFVYSIHYDEFDVQLMDSKDYVRLNAKQIKKQNDKIFKMINDYGKTLDNINHGNNLLQKMITEGRLRVINIDDLIPTYNADEFIKKYRK
ncbi:hypothetical protein MOO46_07780 (plasmid) [Apilactobacillus apisilvae]|uniref:Bacteriophage abortive infection AbiH n=1 Tax=Apilactobacillus apisilvae TaxID=2923364 RepID=A0ABY4PKJ9_9LACO|nr:AbiH family protein [Apilactobacillus apisilvae]UQS85831.1 hypothetical protein MOO46_07780 [Apilactobacillus apisilvae]